MKSILWVMLLTLIVAQGAAAAEPEHLIYLHGAIVENQGLPAVHPVFGEYAFDDIVAALTDSGFVVQAEVRSRTTDLWVPARAAAAEIEKLLADGVAPDHITVVGASLGGFIAGIVSHLVGQAEVRYVLLGVCSAGAQAWWLENDVQLTGRVLSIHEKTDPGHGSCGETFARCSDSLTRVAEIEIETGRQHGFLYQPLEAWLAPTVVWARKGGI